MMFPHLEESLGGPAVDPHQPSCCGNDVEEFDMNVGNLIATAIGLVVYANLVGCVAPAAADRMAVAEPDSPCPLASQHANSIVLSEVIGGEPTDPLGHSTVDNEGLEAAILASLDHYGLLGVEGPDSPFDLRVALAELIQSGSGFTMSVTAFVRYKLSELSSDVSLYDDVVEGHSTLSVSDELVGIERLRRANEDAVRETILTFFSAICTLEIATMK